MSIQTGTTSPVAPGSGNALSATAVRNRHMNSVVMALGNPVSLWTVRNAVEGVQIFGGIGSGKTSGSGRTLALTYLARGFGGLVLTVKPDELARWEEYCGLTGRSDDLRIIGEGGKYHFNFLDYVSTGGLTDNVVQVLKTAMRAGGEKDEGHSHDPFWETALDMLMFYVVDLCRMAYGSVSVRRMYDIVQSLPRLDGKDRAAGRRNAFLEATAAAAARVNAEIADKMKDIGPDVLRQMQADQTYEIFACTLVPDARLLRLAEQYFMDTYLNLSEKTRSIIDFSFSAFLFRFFSEPFHALFCAPGEQTQAVLPEDSADGKIIVINLPVKKYHKVGRDCQIMFKYIWQRAMEQRTVTEDSLPVFLWADEAQHFLHEHDAEFQATARSSMIATVYLSQNLPNYYANMGGAKSEYRVKSFLGTLSTKIFHANADVETNTYASELVGDHEVKELSVSQGQSGGSFTSNQSVSRKVERILRPEYFQGLANGGPENNNKVRAVVHTQGKTYRGDYCHVENTFDQNYPLSPAAGTSPRARPARTGKTLLQHIRSLMTRFRTTE